jgi:hypothetical protein
MNESSNDQADDRSGIGETITTALRKPDNWGCFPVMLKV